MGFRGAYPLMAIFEIPKPTCSITGNGCEIFSCVIGHFQDSTYVGTIR